MPPRPLDRTVSVHVGERLRALRRERGWTLAYASPRIGMPVAMLSKLERGERMVTVDDLVRLGRGLGMSPTILLPGELWS